MIMRNLKDAPLFAFATAMEFSKVFPEDAASFATIPLNSLISLGGRYAGAKACVLGVGILEFSANLSQLLFSCKLAGESISSVVNVGICGVYPNRKIPLTSVVCVESDRVGDEGVEESDGSFTSWAKTYKGAAPEFAPEQIREFVCKLETVAGVTVNCCTGTASTARLREQIFDADVESMEGAACFAVCERFGIPALQIRAISNVASIRDKSQWQVNEALSKLKDFVEGVCV